MNLSISWQKWLLSFGLLFIGLVWWPNLWMPFHDAKWLAFHFVAILGVASFLIGPTIVTIPNIKEKKPLIFLGALLLLILAHLAWTQYSGPQFVLLNRISFFVVVGLAWSLFSQRALQWQDFYFPILALLLATSLYGLYQLAEIGFPKVVPFTEVGSTFGHTSQTAQSIGFLLIFLLSLQAPKDRLNKIILSLVCAISISYFLLLRSRSTLIGMLLALIVYFILKRGEKIAWKRFGAVALLALALFVGIQLGKGRSVEEVARFQILQDKSPMTLWRAEIWKQTLQMFKDNPLGVGTDRYRELFLPYYAKTNVMSETVLVESPHNEFLRYLVEDGILLSLCYLAAFFFLFKSFFRKANRSEKLLYLPIGAFLFVEMLVQMPLREPFPVFIFAIFIGYMLAVVYPDRKKLSKINKGLLAILLILQVGLISTIFISKLYEKSEEVEKTSLACNILPSNWKACLEASRVAATNGDLKQGRKFALMTLDRAPMNFLAYRFLSIIAAKDGSHLESCFYLWKYDYILQENSSLHTFLETKCPKKWLDYFKRKRPNKYYQRDKNGVVISP